MVEESGTLTAQPANWQYGVGFKSKWIFRQKLGENPVWNVFVNITVFVNIIVFVSITVFVNKPFL